MFEEFSINWFKGWALIEKVLLILKTLSSCISVCFSVRCLSQNSGRMFMHSCDLSGMSRFFYKTELKLWGILCPANVKPSNKAVFQFFFFTFAKSLHLLVIHNEQESGQTRNLIHHLAESPPSCSLLSYLQLKTTQQNTTNSIFSQEKACGKKWSSAQHSTGRSLVMCLILNKSLGFVFWQHVDSDRWSLFGNPWLSWHHPHLWTAHVEDVGLYRSKHCHCSGYLWRFVDELCDREHRCIAVPTLLLCSGFTTGAAGVQGPGLCVHCYCSAGHWTHCGWPSLHKLLFLWLGDQSQMRHCWRCGVYFSRTSVFNSCQLVSLHHHHRLLQPSDSKWETGRARSVHICGLGCWSFACHWRRDFVLHLQTLNLRRRKTTTMTNTL